VVNLRLVKALTTAAVLGLTMSACVVVPRPYSDYPSSGVYADAPPPAPRYDVVPVAPFVGAIWIGGYWNWYGGRRVWVPGRWVPPHHHHGYRY
jgi:WXXGXW repeat (2 copies)